MIQHDDSSQQRPGAAPLRLLIVEDAETDARLLVRELRRGGYQPSWCRAETAEELTAALDEGGWDLVLLDYRLPSFNAPAALKILRERDSDLPAIVVSGTMGEEMAVEAMRTGANDYLLKGALTRLIPVVQRELREAEHRRQAAERLRRSEEQFRVAFEKAGSGMALVDLDYHYVMVNDRLCGILGYEREEVLSRRVPDITHPEDFGVDAEYVRRLLDGEATFFRREKRYIRKDGDTVYAGLTVSLVREPAGKPLYFLTVVDDHTQIRRWRIALEESEERFRTVFEKAASGIAIVALDFRYLDVNDRFCEILGYTHDELLSMRVLDVTHPDDVEQTRGHTRQLVAGEAANNRWEKRYIRKDGRTVHASITVSLVRDAAGEPLHLLSVIEDITEQRRSEQALRASEERYRSVVETSLDGIVLADLGGTIVFANRRLADMLGLRDPGELVGRHLLSIIAPEDRERAIAAWTPFAERGEARDVPLSLRRADGSYIPIEASGSSMTDGDGNIVAVTGVIKDVTERKAYEQQLEHQALHDPLTGLPNHVLLFDRLEQVVRRGQREQEVVAVLLIDLNHFKEVNDAFGHTEGDRALRELGTRLPPLLRDSDTVARMGGDEFTVVLPDVDPQAAIAIADRVLEALDQPVEIEGTGLVVGATVGLALYPEHGDDAVTLLRHADIAMHTAKRDRSGLQLFQPEEDRYSMRKLKLAADLRRALNEGGLSLHYQPKLSLQTGCVEGVEALARWQHPEHGFIPPDEFVELAEHVGLIRPLTLWVLGEALRQQAEWAARGVALSVAVNLAVQNLLDAKLIASLEELLRCSGANPSRLVLEITESGIMTDPEMARENIIRLHDLGIRMSIDDFGTGYSSLAYLKNLPVDEVKIDRSFVMHLAENREDASIVRAVIDLGHELSVQVVAEGVETAEILAQLSRRSCDYAQGYFISRPLPSADLLAWWESQTARSWPCTALRDEG